MNVPSPAVANDVPSVTDSHQRPVEHPPPPVEQQHQPTVVSAPPLNLATSVPSNVRFLMFIGI